MTKKKTNYFGVRFREGEDCWTCPSCGAVTLLISGRDKDCACGYRYLDYLARKHNATTARARESASADKITVPATGAVTVNPKPCNGEYAQSTLKLKETKE